MVLTVDIFMFSLSSQSKAISHLSFGVLTAQLIALLVFYKGEICPGQRGRLIKVNSAFALYWVIWLIISLLPNYKDMFETVMSVCGLSVVYFICKQPKEEKIRNSFLLMATLVTGLGMLSYFLSLSLLPLPSFAAYNPAALILAGVILANLMLVIACSRLQGFIALLPLAMITLLAVNALVIFVFLLINDLESAVDFESLFAYGIYFICHFMIAAILVLHSIKKWALSINSLFILLFITVCLPLWMEFI
ncbi:hypothetical protein HEMROJRC1_04320 [Rodentibacter sp. JRC1]|nr:hypothetical protein HEMROJRC1_04320 [Rodentibacter sp. JRC1]